MAWLRQYIGSIICVSLICGIVLSLVQEQGVKTILKLVCGMLLVLTVVSPLAGFDLDGFLAELFPSKLDSQTFTHEGENMARETMAELIKQESEAYILDKATSLYGEVAVEIFVSGDEIPLPVSAEISGRIPPYGKRQLEEILQKDLGISKENVRWTG